MARVNLDGKVWKDPRVKRLARRRSWSIRETVGTLAAVWDVAYDNKTPIMPRIDVDTAAEADNFAADMVAEDLATPITDDLVSVRLRGVTERIQYLLAQAAKGRRGGLAKAAKHEDAGTFVAGAKPEPSTGQATAKQAGSLPLDLDLAPDLDPDPVQGRDQDRVAARAARAVDLDPEAVRLARLLVDGIAGTNPETKIARLSEQAKEGKARSWATHLEKLHRIDKIAVPDIEAAIDFATRDPFWCSNILSGAKLREKYDQLVAQMKRKGPQAAGHAKPSADAADYEAAPSWMGGAS